jgi:hypothetical protein
LAHAGLLAQSHRGLRADPAVKGRERPGDAAREGQPHAFEFLREFRDHVGERAAIDVAHRSHLRGQAGLQILGQVGQGDVGALVQKEADDDRGLLRTVEMRGRRASRGGVDPCRWCTHGQASLVP